jgi:GntR family transcriptional regulator / MocR family aminotransferase
MGKRSKHFLLLAKSLDPSKRASLESQLYEEIRTAIIEGLYRPGMRLPSTRVLASDLGISRNTAANAFDQLAAEGYLRGRVGSGTYVAGTLPDAFFHANSERSALPQPRSPQAASHRLAKWQALGKYFPPVNPVPFRHGLPALDEFPARLWGQIAARRYRNLPAGLLGYGTPAGYAPLRKVLADYLAISRSVRAQHEQIIIVGGGSQQALYLATQLLLEAGDAAWIEDPGYLGARSTLEAAGAQLVPIPVDDQGIQIGAGIRTRTTPKLIYVSPSNQYPLTVTMSLARRMELLEFAHRSGAWIVEDDYDSEFRYRSRPIPALQGLGHHNRVIYIGTFSKLLIPTLRLGFIVAPPELVDGFTALNGLITRNPPAIEQLVLTDFIEQGHLGRHIRRMRMLYLERQNYFLDVAAREVDGLLELNAAPAGTHLIGWLPHGAPDVTWANAAHGAGVETMPLSKYCLRRAQRGGLVLGYAAYGRAATRSALQKLSAALCPLVGKELWSRPNPHP